MSYAVKEIFYTLQGEGANTGRPAVFCRFAGCNLWTGREQDRHAAVCTFCDTDFVGTDGPGGGKFATADELADAVAAKWPATDLPTYRPTDLPTYRPTDVPSYRPTDVPTYRPTDLPTYRLTVLTGGEPFLQLDSALTAALHARGFEIAVETNGTVARPPGVDWLCVSPKAEAPLILTWGDELKLVFPQVTAPPEKFHALDFTHFFLQPMDGPERERNTRLALEYCLAHPRWRLSLQTHKMLGIP